MTISTSAGLEQLSAEECRDLLATHHFGRLAIAVNGQPLVFPLNYCFERDRIVFRTDPGLKLRHTPLRRVAFEIDGLDDGGRGGWSVLVKGTTYEITRAVDQLSEELRRLPVRPLAPGEKAHWIEIVPVEITGRRIRPAEERR